MQVTPGHIPSFPTQVPTPNSVFRALADPTRRRILQLLRNGPLTSGDIAARFETAWPTISRHLSVLREADLVLAERNGNSIRYELNTTVFHDVVDGLLDLVQPGGRDA
jgi:DNA-binding transcriptional ArsR family regulator